MQVITAAGIGVVFILLLLLVRWKWRAIKWREAQKHQALHEQQETMCQSCNQVQMLHRLCPHHNVIQRFPVEAKDSLDEHLDVLTRKLAEKAKKPETPSSLLDEYNEGRLRLSKSKIRQTQNEIENLHAIDHDVKLKYREIMESLRNDLLANEKECKKLQEQIEWVSRRRAELKIEVHRGQKLYGEAAVELASNLAELQRGRLPEHRIIDKPQNQLSVSSLRIRKEPHLPRASPVGSVLIKTSSPVSPMRGVSQAEI